jgi:hypothetical protein
MSFIKEYLIEIAEYPRFPDGTFKIKDYFYYDSNIQTYGHRETIVPVSLILNKEELPSADVIKSLINNSEPVMKRLIDVDNQTEHWVFIPTEENKK